jgi:D-serine deaminase-like pyridoxal phosphate-dependent protein
VTNLRDLDTPAVTIDLAIMDANIRRVQAQLDRLGVANRPHVKTHKIPAIGRMQMEAGAVGITVQKVGEAEVFADAGVADDVLLTYNVLARRSWTGSWRWRRRSGGSRWSWTTTWWRAGSPRPARGTASTCAS